MPSYPPRPPVVSFVVPGLALLSALLSALLVASSAAPLTAAPHPNLQRGFQPHGAFAVGDLDSVNLLNGNLVVRIPVGGTYPVAGDLAYAVRLTYNSKAWDHEETGSMGQLYPKAVPGRLANAGLGWSLSLGRLLAPGDPAAGALPWQWVYIDPDGGDHVFYQGLHVAGPSGVDPCDSVCFTRDGTYLRMRALSETSRVVEKPNGERHVFTRFAAGGGGIEWRLSAIEDRSEDGLRDLDISYSADGHTWTLTDKHDRIQRVIFEPDPAASLTRRLRRVELTAFGGATAVYTFTYLPVQSVRVPCSSTLPFWDEVPVSLLSAIQLPDGSSYDFTYHHPVDGGDCRARGVLASMRLPTQGTVEWDYRLHTLPVQACSFRGWHSHSLGVASRTLRDAAGAADGVWTYSASLSPAPAAEGTFWCEPLQPFRPPAEELAVSVVDPAGDKTVHYFSVWPGAEFPVTTAFDADDYGLPFTRRVSDATGSRFLSREVYDCDAAGQNCGPPVRSAYLRFERDATPACSVPFDPACLATHRRAASERTVFHDDGDRFVDVDRSDFDGFGHYRSVTTLGNFGPDVVRTETTDYNPGGVLPGGTWVLDTFTGRTVTETGGWTTEVARTEHCFDSATGALARLRVHKGTAGPGAGDLVTVFIRDAAGNVVREERHGGDGAGIASGPLCGLPLGPEAFRLDRTWAFGGLESETWMDEAGGPMLSRIDRQIDPGSGLPAAVRDPSGLTTALEFDPLGRPTWQKPQAGHGAWIQYTYTPASAAGQPARVLVRRRDNPAIGGSETATVLSRGFLDFDGFGRLLRERDFLPDGTWSNRKTTHDALGRLTSVSEVHTGAVSDVTLFLDHDPFGRPRTVRPPEGGQHDATWAYRGIRQVTRTTTVGTRQQGGTVLEEPMTVTEEYDPRGRPWRITEPHGPTGEAVTTEYSWNVGDRVTQVCVDTAAPGGCGQRRVFTWDQRGFLMSEQHPEKGVTGNAKVLYRKLDALGRVGRRVDGASDLLFTYDRAGRLTEVRDRLDGHRLLKSFQYATTNAPGDWKQGKLEVATRFNRPPGAPAASYPVEELYTYGGRDGRPSQRTTRVWGDGVELAAFTQTFTHDALGNLNSLGYPRCLDCPAPVPRTVDLTYTEGRLSAVPGYASSVTYHPHGGVHQVSHANGTVDTFVPDPHRRPRPAAINTRRAGTTLWATGTHAWDGSGNLVGVGASWFEYFPAGRLKTASQVDPSSVRHSRSYTWDTFGNLTSFTTQIADGAPVTRNTPASTVTNRLLGATGYDTSGNLTAWNGAAYAYDPLHRLVRTTSGGEDWAHLYTADDERLVSLRLGSSPLRRWTIRDLERRVLRDYRQQGGTWSVERDYIYRGDRLLATETPAGVRHFHLDHLGTPRLITDALGTVLAAHLYHPFGEELTDPVQDTERMKLAGQERDLNAVTGADPDADDLDYLHARFYNPQIGRFLTPDPLTVGRRATRSMNRYGYAFGNPMVFADPSGLEPELRFSDAITVIAPFLANPLHTVLAGRLFSSRTGADAPQIVESSEEIAESPADTGDFIGFDCQDTLNPASSLGITAGVPPFGISIDALLVWGTRIEVSISGPLGGGLGINAAVLGLSYGHSRGLSAGANAVAGMPAGFGGFVSANTPGSGSDSGSFFLGAGPNVVPTVVAAGGGLSYTVEVLDKCGR